MMVPGRSFYPYLPAPMTFDLTVLIAGPFIIALVYASVGFGGGSSYLALLALPAFALAFPVIRSTALFCNIIVVTGGTIFFYREGKLSFRDVWPYLITSVPAAYIGGFWPIKQHTFFVLLGITLVVVSFLLWLQPERFLHTGKGIPENKATQTLLGASIGFLSGLVGIGGGIFSIADSAFSQVVGCEAYFGIGKPVYTGEFYKRVGRTVLSGRAGHARGVYFTVAGSCVCGVGRSALRLGAHRFNPLYIKRITAVLILVAGVNILKDHL